jgi:hypothetical protein
MNLDDGGVGPAPASSHGNGTPPEPVLQFAVPCSVRNIGTVRASSVRNSSTIRTSSVRNIGALQ